ncbi:hypothetical protein BDM02DRAFT_3090968 [Thelephora ganbajun]|uniref:Uncharacterized protein n=1 Tax=Thelephora ganbajun TaxID=370292 RepID=A0ACB6ZQ53_THEGA|nr:hypothetical protein BDM02DRAFT_3090968 [Thelephora ganbajun]
MSGSSNRFAHLADQEPVVEDGIEYWESQPASLDGVLGGFGTGSLPRIDALGSRQLLLELFPELCTVPSPLKLATVRERPARFRALDVGAGIGRVTRDVLLHLVQDVVLVEPVDKYIQEAWSRAQFQENPIDFRVPWKGVQEKKTSVTLIQSTHQSLDPLSPLSSTKFIGRVGYKPSPNELEDINSKFDVIWCQWSLGHLSNPDLVIFLGRAKQALRDPESVIIVKENVCGEIEGSTNGGVVFDDQDSSLTRSNRMFKQLFKEASLSLYLERAQEGFPEGLFEVKM